MQCLETEEDAAAFLPPLTCARLVWCPRRPDPQVALWLGANVMVEYSYADAVTLLEDNLAQAEEKVVRAPPRRMGARVRRTSLCERPRAGGNVLVLHCGASPEPPSPPTSPQRHYTEDLAYLQSQKITTEVSPRVAGHMDCSPLIIMCHWRTLTLVTSTTLSLGAVQVNMARVYNLDIKLRRIAKSKESVTA